MDNKKRRHGFVTFWLWFSIVVNVIFTPISMASLEYIKINAGNTFSFAGVEHSIISFMQSSFFYLYINMVIQAIFIIVGYAKLLRWKKSGFWLIVEMQILTTAINIFLYASIGKILISHGWIAFNTMQMIISSIIGVIFGLVVLRAILQIRKEGVSCWEQLD